MTGNRNKLLLAGGLSLAFLLFSKSANATGQTITKGGAINNPGNIEEEQKTYTGEINSPSSVFKSFVSLVDGFAAMITKLDSYFSEGYTTLRELITHWAPAADGNDPDTYVSYIIAHMGDPVDPDAEFPIGDDNTILAVISIMADVEQGAGFSDRPGVWEAAVASVNLV